MLRTCIKSTVAHTRRTDARLLLSASFCNHAGGGSFSIDLVHVFPSRSREVEGPFHFNAKAEQKRIVQLLYQRGSLARSFGSVYVSPSHFKFIFNSNRRSLHFRGQMS